MAFVNFTKAYYLLHDFPLTIFQLCVDGKATQCFKYDKHFEDFFASNSFLIIEAYYEFRLPLQRSLKPKRFQQRANLQLKQYVVRLSVKTL
jgi:hypothetical protein